MDAPLLDTHAWIWYAADPAQLRRDEVEGLDAFPAEDRPWISDFSLWEMATLVSLGRVRLDRPLEQWLSLAARPAVVRIASFSVAEALELAGLPDSLHRDPADRAIVATARARGLCLLTRDRRILDSGLARIWTPS